MRQQDVRSMRAWTIAAVIMAIVALLVLLGDGLLVASNGSVGVPFLRDEGFPWMLVLAPVLLAGGVTIGFRTSPTVGLLAIFIAVAEERFAQSLLPHGGVNLRLDELLVPAIAAGLLLREWRVSKLRKDWPRIPGLALLGLFLVANLVPTLFVMHDHARGLSLFTILIAGAVCYTGVAILVSRVAEIEDIVLPIALVGAFEAIFGLGALGVALALGRSDIFGVQTDPATKIVAPYGTMFEANFFGQFLVAIFLLSVAFLFELAAQRRLRSPVAVAVTSVVILAFLGTLASGTRASWLALAIGVMALALLLPLRRTIGGLKDRSPLKTFKRWLPAVVTGALLVTVTVTLIVIASPDSPLGQRLSSILDFSSGSGFGRLRVLVLVINDWSNPILGMGDGSFNVSLPPFPGRPPDPPWIFSMFLAVAHDSGIVGLTLLLAFLAVIYRGLFRVIRRTYPRPIQVLAIGMVAVLSSLLVSAQATTSMYLLFFWAFVGIAGAVPLIARTSEGGYPATIDGAQPSILDAPESLSITPPPRVPGVSHLRE
jgi:hypothetical protein